MPRYLSLLGGAAGGSSGYRGLQVVATRNQLYGAVRQGTAGGRSDTCLQGRRRIYLGRSAVSGLRAGVCPYYINSGSGEVIIPNAYTLEAAVELTSPSTHQPFVFRNTKSMSVPLDSPLILSDPIPFDFAAGGDFWLRIAALVESSSHYLPASGANAASGDAGKLSPSTTSQVFGTGAFTTPSGGTDFGAGPGLQLLLGVPAEPMASVAIYGDSIANENNDTVDAYGNMGFVARGLASVNGYPVPYVKLTQGGWSYGKATLDAAPRMRSVLPYVTHVINELGTNDISNGTSLSTLQTLATGLWAAQKRTIGPYGKPLHVAQTLVMPRVTSTDSYATAVNQTPVAGFAVGGVRDQFNAWVRSQVGNGILDSAIDPNVYVEDQANPGKWVTTGAANYPTNDGIHPSPAAHTLAAQAVNAWALTIAP